MSSFRVRDGSCLNVCPVECIVPGGPYTEQPLFDIHQEACMIVAHASGNAG